MGSSLSSGVVGFVIIYINPEVVLLCCASLSRGILLAVSEKAAKQLLQSTIHNHYSKYYLVLKMISLL